MHLLKIIFPNKMAMELFFSTYGSYRYVEMKSRRRTAFPQCGERLLQGCKAFPQDGGRSLRGCNVFPQRGETLVQGCNVFPQCGMTLLQGCNVFPQDGGRSLRERTA